MRPALDLRGALLQLSPLVVFRRFHPYWSHPRPFLFRGLNFPLAPNLLAHCQAPRD